MTIDTMPAAQAVEALIHQYGRLVFQVIYGLTGDWHESQDALCAVRYSAQGGAGSQRGRAGG